MQTHIVLMGFTYAGGGAVASSAKALWPKYAGMPAMIKKRSASPNALPPRSA